MSYEMNVKGNKLVIEVDISDKTIEQSPLSKTGKSKVIATTNGFTTVDEKRGVRASFNIITRS